LVDEQKVRKAIRPKEVLLSFPELLDQKGPFRALHGAKGCKAAR